MLTGSSFAEEGWRDTNSYWETLLLRKAGQTPSSSTKEDGHTPMLTGSSSVEEGWTDTNAYWEAPLLRKAGQMQCLLDRHKFLLGSSSAEKGWICTKLFY